MKNKYLSLFVLIFSVGIAVYYLRFAITPFAISLVISYLTLPIVNFANKHKIPRGVAALFIVLTLLFCLIYLFAMLIPFLIEKISGFISSLGQQILGNNLQEFLLNHFSIIGKAKAIYIQNSISDLLKNIVNLNIGYIITNIKTSGNLIFTILIVIIPCPVITFFMLRDWDKMIIKIHNAVPRRYIKNFILITDEMGSNLSKYLSGQMQVCFILSIFYSIPLYLIGLDFGIPIGIMTGCLAFIPYIGVIISTIITVIAAAMQFGDVHHILLVLGFLMIGQAVDGSMITPRIIGDKMNIHPTWVILGLFTSVVLFGTIGAIFALPITACGSVVIKFIIQKYKKSQYYINSGSDNYFD